MNVVVVGGGPIGASVAWRLAVAGASVRLYDPDPGSAAGRVAAGMLAPVSELHDGEESVSAFALRSVRRWPSFAAELEQASGDSLGYVDSGTLLVARDRDDLAQLDVQAQRHADAGLTSERVDARRARRLEPALTPSVRGALWVAGDHQVDPRRLLRALEAGALAAGVEVLRRRVSAVDGTKVALEGEGQDRGDAVVVCAGHAARDLLAELPVRPVKGQILRLAARPRSVVPTRVVRGTEVYVVPRPSGEIVVGATTEEQGADRTVTAGAVRELLREAWTLVPGLDEAELVEAAAGLRPTTPDNAPVIDRIDDGLVVAAGHHRHGILLAPATADAVVTAVLEGDLPDAVAPFRSNRFREAAA